MKYLIILLLFIPLLSYWYEDKEKMFIKAQKIFIEDMGHWLHKYQSTEKNKCKYNIASVAYGFAWQESTLGSFWMSLTTKNWTSLHPWGSYYYKWKPNWGKTCKWECLRNYKTVMQWLVDFMYLYKYWYGCNVDQEHINYYILGNKPTNEHTKEYRKNLLKRIEYFENKYFSKLN